MIIQRELFCKNEDIFHKKYYTSKKFLTFNKFSQLSAFYDMSKMSNILKITLAYQVLTNMYVLSLSLIFQTLFSMGQNCSKGSKGEASPSKEMVSFLIYIRLYNA